MTDLDVFFGQVGAFLAEVAAHDLRHRCEIHAGQASRHAQRGGVGHDLVAADLERQFFQRRSQWQVSVGNHFVFIHVGAARVIDKGCPRREFSAVSAVTGFVQTDQDVRLMRVRMHSHVAGANLIGVVPAPNS